MNEIAPPPDSILVVSFGGPERPDDVMPFLRNVTAGRAIPEERLHEVAGHYTRAGGRSPLNDQIRALISALRKELDERGPNLPIYWGNRNWHPFLKDTMQEMIADGRHHAVAFITSAYSSYSSCKQYLEDISRAQAEVGANAPIVERTRHFYNHPGFIEPMVRNVNTALSQLPDAQRADARLVFTAHSIPQAMAEKSRYTSQLLEASRLVVERLDADYPHAVVYQSRSGPPHVPWLEPDVCDYLQTLHSDGAKSVVIVPIGFISDNMEVIHDLDVEALTKADELGMIAVRAATVGVDPQFVSAVRDLINERLDVSSSRAVLGTHGVVTCLSADCCLPR